jgi:acyl-coenzyme A thioesterase PaaI-like protein
LTRRALQDQIPHNHCFGCGPDNSRGLRIKSFWDGAGPSVAKFSPQWHHCAGPKHFVNGGVLATIVDCHCICTAAAAAYFDAGRAVGELPFLHYATANLALTYRRPTPIGRELVLTANIDERKGSTYVLSCTVEADAKVCVEARVEAVQVPDSWVNAPRSSSDE